MHIFISVNMASKIFRLLVIYHILVLCIGCAQCLLKKNRKCIRKPESDYPKVNVSLKVGQRMYEIYQPDSHLMVPHLHSGAGPRSKEVVFDCNASYPIEWVFQSPKHHERMNFVEETKYIPKSSEPWNSIYSARLRISVPHKAIKETKQTCRSVNDKSCSQTTVFMKRAGPANNETWAISITPNDPKGITLVDYDAQRGMNPNCTMSLTYNPSDKLFCCVSLTGANVSITENLPCKDPNDCRQLYSESKCTMDFNSFAECPENSFSLPLAETESDFQSAGVISCHEESRDEISSAKHYFYSLPKLCDEDSNRLPSLNFHWFDAKLFEFLSMCQRTEPVYIGEKINFTCIASLYYTASGMQFAIQRQPQENHDVEEIVDYVTRHEVVDHDKGFRNLSMEILINSTDIQAIVCLAPQRKSTEWVRKEVHLNILDPTEITFEKTAEAIPYREALILRCQAHGKPKPSLMWFRDGIELRKNLNITVNSNDLYGWTELYFPDLDDPSTLLGQYTCRAKNQLGQKDKVFLILDKNAIRESDGVHESETLSSFYIKAVLLPIVIIIVVLIFIFLIWKIVQQTRKLRKLTHAEIEEFMNGKPDVVKSYRESNYEINSYANCLPYNKKYEILKDQLEIDENAILGTGAYGMVLKGTLTTKTKTKVKVAIKTVKPMDDITYFKALLSELKIMAFIGKHVNIINLIGAYTSNIEKREIYIATEFCDNGNVLSFLKRNRASFTNILQNGELNAETSFSRVSYGSISSATTISTINLLKWASQIAGGMEFLGTKKVIHGDLAARNVFLSIDLVVKIGDFGLSKQLFEYANYIKKNQSPLPWKWLAIECLQDMQFSVKSDVWAYGITCWEIFSLGMSPYIGAVYNEEFVNRLVSGVRPSMPQYAPNNVYEKMNSCWDQLSSNRPTFKDLKLFFDSQLDIVVPKDYMDLEEKEVTPIVQVKHENECSTSVCHKTVSD